MRMAPFWFLINIVANNKNQPEILTCAFNWSLLFAQNWIDTSGLKTY